MPSPFLTYADLRNHGVNETSSTSALPASCTASEKKEFRMESESRAPVRADQHDVDCMRRVASRIGRDATTATVLEMTIRRGPDINSLALADRPHGQGPSGRAQRRPAIEGVGSGTPHRAR